METLDDLIANLLTNDPQFNTVLLMVQDKNVIDSEVRHNLYRRGVWLLDLSDDPRKVIPARNFRQMYFWNIRTDHHDMGYIRSRLRRHKDDKRAREMHLYYG